MSHGRARNGCSGDDIRALAIPFRDRTAAGLALAELVKPRVPDSDAIVLALPRGGVPVGACIAKAVGAPLDVMLVRKLGVPGEEELAVGAIASGGVRVLNRDLVAMLRVSSAVINELTRREQQELERREALYRRGRPALGVEGRPVILTDDGLATGATMLAAARALRLRGAGRIVVAIPVACPQSCERVRNEVDEVICALAPDPFGAVGAWFRDFSQIRDEDVCELLEAAAGRVRQPV